MIPKNTTIQFIYNGELKSYKVMYLKDVIINKHNFAIYISDDIDTMQILRTNKNEIIVITSRSYIDTLDETELEMHIYNGLLKIAYKNSSESFYDICTAAQYGYTRVINDIKMSNSKDAEARIEKIQEYMLKQGTDKLPSLDSLVKTLK